MSSSSRVEILEDSDPEVIVIHEDDSEDDECFDMSNPMAHVKKDPSPPQAATKSAGAQGKVVQQTRKQAKAIKSKTDNTSPSQPTEDPLTKAKPSVATGNASAKLSPSHSAKKPGNTNNGGPALRSPLSESDLDESFVSVQKVVASTSSTESSDVDETLPVNRTSITLSKWASRFLAPRAPAALVEDVDLQPMQDFILDDFGTRFRGDTTTSDHEHDEHAEASDGDESSRKLAVGAPIVQKSPPLGRPDKPNAPPPGNASRPRPESRYFKKDLTTKCFNCGEIGHMSNACVNSTVLRPCCMCGYRNHKSNECPHLLCHRCHEPGHELRNCPNGRQNISFCATCGASDHVSRECPPRLSDVKYVRCMVCFERGHLTCVPHSRPANKRIYCPQCCGPHPHEECYGGGRGHRGRSSYEDRSARPRYNEDNGRRRDNLPALSNKTCYNCNNTGHIASNCPTSKPRGVKHQRFESTNDTTNYSSKRQRVDDNHHDNQSYARTHFARR